MHQNKGRILSYLRPVDKTDIIVVRLQDSIGLAEFEVIKSLTRSGCQFVGFYFRAVCAAAFSVYPVRLWLGIKSELPKQLQLRQNVALEIDMEKAREDIRVLLDKFEIFFMSLGNFNTSASADFMSCKHKLRQKIRTELKLRSL